MPSLRSGCNSSTQALEIDYEHYTTTQAGVLAVGGTTPMLLSKAIDLQVRKRFPLEVYRHTCKQY